MKISVYYNDKFDRKAQLERALNSINSVQNYFAFLLKGIKSPNNGSEMIDWDVLCTEMAQNSEYEIYITNQAFTDNWFSHEESHFSVISTCDWENLYAPPSLKAYLMYQMAQSAIIFAADLSEDMEMRMVHEPSKGCVFDICTFKDDIKLGMVGGAICSECKGTLRSYGVEDRAIEAVEKIVAYVRDEAIGRPRSLVGNKAFVVMRFSSNDENDHVYKYAIKPALQEMNIKCDRADETLASGPLLEKVTNSIKSARFIIAKVDQDNLNVYYELGLSMGLEKDVILIAENKLVLNLPSDLKNWECVTYPEGDYEALKSSIIKFFNDNYEFI